MWLGHILRTLAVFLFLFFFLFLTVFKFKIMNNTIQKTKTKRMSGEMQTMYMMFSVAQQSLTKKNKTKAKPTKGIEGTSYANRKQRNLFIKPNKPVGGI